MWAITTDKVAILITVSVKEVTTILILELSLREYRVKGEVLPDKVDFNILSQLSSTGAKAKSINNAICSTKSKLLHQIEQLENTMHPCKWTTTTRKIHKTIIKTDWTIVNNCDCNNNKR